VNHYYVNDFIVLFIFQVKLLFELAFKLNVNYYTKKMHIKVVSINNNSFDHLNNEVICLDNST
jgi:hypothetical protein